MTKISNLVIKFKDRRVLNLGKRDSKMVMKSWKKEFLLLEKTKHI
jgi:hypothetical protein